MATDDNQRASADAVAIARKAVEIYRCLRSAQPSVFTGDLAGAGTTLTDIVDAVGRHDEANELRPQVNS